MSGELVTGDVATEDIAGLEAALGHAFASPALLAEAVTHPSLAGVAWVT